MQKVYINDVSQYISGGASCSVYISQSNEGQTIKIEAADESAVRTAKLQVTVDDPSIVSFGFPGSSRYVTLEEGTQTILFDPTVETAIQVSHTTYNKILNQVPLNDEIQTASGGTYYFEIKDGDKVALIGINGSVLRSATTAEGTTTLSDIVAGTYIVTVGGKAFKIAVAQ